jgi:hypothetical protein
MKLIVATLFSHERTRAKGREEQRQSSGTNDAFHKKESPSSCRGSECKRRVTAPRHFGASCDELICYILEPEREEGYSDDRKPVKEKEEQQEKLTDRGSLLRRR